VRDWLLGSSAEERKEIGSDIKSVQWRWPVGKPLVGSFGGGLYEVRTASREGSYRVFFCIRDGVMVLLHAFRKKTRATPAKDLDLARRRQHEVEHE
jgi:phage-related protein